MTRPLRRAHHAIFVMLAILLPVVIAIAIAGRQGAGGRSQFPTLESSAR